MRQGVGAATLSLCVDLRLGNLVLHSGKKINEFGNL